MRLWPLGALSTLTDVTFSQFSLAVFSRSTVLGRAWRHDVGGPRWRGFLRAGTSCGDGWARAAWATSGAAYDGVLDREAVVRLLESDHDDRSTAQFFREARAIATLSHPGVVDLLDVGLEESGDRFLVMKPVRGRARQQVLREDGAPSIGAGGPQPSCRGAVMEGTAALGSRPAGPGAGPAAAMRCARPRRRADAARTS